MGLDVILGVFVLIWAIRGWFRGFVLQAIGLASLVGCVYLADPVRAALRPYAQEVFPSIAPPVLDRLLWWGSAVGSYVVTSGLATMVVRLRRRQSYGVPVEPNRGDQGAGFLLGGAKGAVAASFLAMLIARHAPSYVKPGGVMEEQTRSSLALSLSERYRPAEQLWNSPPVQAFVAHVRRRGFWEDEPGRVREAEEPPAPDAVASEPPPPGSPPSPPAGPKPVQTARRAPAMAVPRLAPIDPDSPTFLDDVDRELSRLGSRAPKSR